MTLETNTLIDVILRINWEEVRLKIFEPGVGSFVKVSLGLVGVSPSIDLIRIE
jgi:hypothetical protein